MNSLKKLSKDSSLNSEVKITKDIKTQITKLINLIKMKNER